MNTNNMTTQGSVCATSNNGVVSASTTTSTTPSNPVPTSMLSFRFATPNNTQTPYYISSDIVLSGGIAQQNRRRIVHNEVEKRRKDKITNWIKKLAELLPRHRIMKQSKNYVLETACEYIEELNEKSRKFSELKQSKELLEQEVTQLRNKVNKLEDENKRLSQLIHEHKVTLPSTWSDVSVITTTMRATSTSSRNGDTQTSSASCTADQEVSLTSQAPTMVPAASDATLTQSNSSVPNRLSVTSILSTASNQPTTSNSRLKTHERLAKSGPTNKTATVSTQSAAVARSVKNVPPTLAVGTWLDPSRSANVTSSAPMSAAQTGNIQRRHNATGASTVSALSQTTRSSNVPISSANVSHSHMAPGARTPTVNTIVQHTFIPQPQRASSAPNATTAAQFPQQTASTLTSFERSFTQVQQLRPNTVQENISQLSYSIDALTGNQTSQNRQQSSGHLSSFSAESLIGRQQPNNDIVMMNSPANQPVIQNTFTLTHPSTLTNANTSNSAPSQSFSNFSALSLVGSNDAYTGSASSTTQTLTRATTTVPESATLPQTTNQMFTDFSTESLIGPSEFTSDFAIDNLISRSDSNMHMATVNPNLIQSFGKGNDPMISSVSGDPGNLSSHVYDPPSLNIGGVFPSHAPYHKYWVWE